MHFPFVSLFFLLRQEAVLTVHPCSAYRGSAEVLKTGEAQQTHASRLSADRLATCSICLS